MYRQWFLVCIILMFLSEWGIIAALNGALRGNSTMSSEGPREEKSRHNHLTSTMQDVLTTIYETSYQGKGTEGLVPGRAVFGAIVLSDKLPPVTHEHYNQSMQKITARVHNYWSLQNELGFTLTRWTGVYTSPCPSFPKSEYTERGVLWAHYRIWRDFAYFDPILEHKYAIALARGGLKHDLVSRDGVYMIAVNGSKYKNNELFRNEDILALFEDDAVSAIDGLNTTLQEEFSDMKVDILFLGWCEGRAAKPVPLCLHAYAITRFAAAKLVHYIEPCGRAVDEQIVMLAKNNWLSYRRAHGFSYAKLKENYSNHGDKTQGIFRQCKRTCGSFNNHRRYLEASPL